MLVLALYGFPGFGLFNLVLVVSGKRAGCTGMDRRETLLVSQIYGINICQPAIQVNRDVWPAVSYKLFIAIKTSQAKADEHPNYWTGLTSITFVHQVVIFAV